MGFSRQEHWSGVPLLLSHKKDEIMPFAATWMQLEIIILSEISQKEKDKSAGSYTNECNVIACCDRDMIDMTTTCTQLQGHSSHRP